MKKILAALLLTLMVVMLVVVPVSAQKSKVIKGEVIAVGDGMLTIESKKGTFSVIVPEGFDMNSIVFGDYVLVKGVETGDASIEADFIKLVGAGNGNKPEGSKDNSAFCTVGKQDKPHPFAPIMAERYGVTAEWVSGFYCQGYSMGAIMLALKTSQMNGMTVDPAALLAGRTEGTAWGQLWKDLGLIGSEKDGHSPPGLLKKSINTGP